MFDQGCTRCGMGHTMVNGQNILCPMLTLLKSFNVAAPQTVVARCQISKGAQLTAAGSILRILRALVTKAMVKKMYTQSIATHDFNS